MKITQGTIVRTVLYIFVVVNLILTSTGHSPIKYTDSAVAEVVSYKIVLFNIWLFVVSAIVFLFRPVFSISVIRISDIATNEQKLVGVDFLTHAIQTELLPSILLTAVIFASLLIFLIWFGKKYGRNYMQAVSDYLVLSSFLFFTAYVYIFMKAQYSYYSNVILSKGGVIGIAIFLFAILNLLFLYLLGNFPSLNLYLPKYIQVKIAQSHVFGRFMSSQNFHHIHYLY